MQHVIWLEAIDESITIDESKFNGNVIEHIHAYGWTQNLSDSYASGKTKAEKKELLNKRLEAFYRGDVRSTKSGDPVGKEVTRLATKLANQYFAGMGYKPSKIPADLWKEYMTKARSDSALYEKAVANVERETAELADLKITL